MNRYLYDFQILELTAFHREAHERAYLLPSCQSGRSRVDVKEIQARVELHLQDVGMPADEKPGRAFVELPADGGGIVAGIASDVRHQHIGLLAFPSELLSVQHPKVAAVAVAAYGPQGAELRQLLCDLHGADVPGVPYLVAFGKVLYVFLVPIAVRVRQHPDAFHKCSFCEMKSSTSSMVESMPRTEELMQNGIHSSSSLRTWELKDTLRSISRHVTVITLRTENRDSMIYWRGITPASTFSFNHHKSDILFKEAL